MFKGLSVPFLKKFTRWIVQSRFNWLPVLRLSWYHISLAHILQPSAPSLRLLSSLDSPVNPAFSQGLWVDCWLFTGRCLCSMLVPTKPVRVVCCLDCLETDRIHLMESILCVDIHDSEMDSTPLRFKRLAVQDHHYRQSCVLFWVLLLWRVSLANSLVSFVETNTCNYVVFICLPRAPNHAIIFNIEKGLGGGIQWL